MTLECADAGAEHEEAAGEAATGDKGQGENQEIEQGTRKEIL
jgi:hypothetical protein